MIREITEKDYEFVYNLGTELHSNFKKTYDLEKLTKEPYFKVLVYEDKNELLGFLIYTNLYNTVDILDIIVKKEKRRQKVATNLIDYLITGLTPEDKIYLEVRVDNTGAIKLYEKFGFVKIHTRKNYYETADAYVMERVI